MQKIFDAGERLFFTILFTCLASFIYFNNLPNKKFTFIVGFIFCIIYFAVNFYVGYKYNLTVREGLIVGIMGAGVGIFLAFFAIYSQLILRDSDTAIRIITPYFMPTMSIIKIFRKEITIIYPFILMFLNILLVIIGVIVRKIINKLLMKI